MEDLEKYVRDTVEPVLTVSQIWEQKTGKSWNEAKQLGLTDGSYSNNMKLLNSLKNNLNTEVIPYLYGTKDIEGITMTAPRDQRIRDQQKIIRDGKYDSGLPYAIVDKKKNDMYLFENNNLLTKEKIVTGRDNKDVDEGLSMKQWLNLPENKGKQHDEYFDYLDSTNSQVTPSGMFTVGKHRTNVTENPDMMGNLLNFFRPEKKEAIKKNREKSYGEAGELLTLFNEDGVYSSKAIHGTGYKDRVEAIKSGKGGDLSNGCINVGGKTMCFETLEEGSRIFILPEESDGTVNPKIKVDGRKDVNTMRDLDNFMRRAKYEMKKAGVELSTDEAKKMFIIHQLESKGGKAYNALEKTMDHLGITNSKGEFQINENEDMKKYLPQNYDFSDVNSQQQAVTNFLRDNANISMDKLYNLYNTGDINKNSNNKERLQYLKDLLSK